MRVARYVRDAGAEAARALPGGRVPVGGGDAATDGGIER